MKKCPAIVGLSFDEESKRGIEEINEIYDLTKIGRLALLIGQFYSIFGGLAVKGSSGSGVRFLDDSLAFQIAGSDAAQTEYAVSQANWEYFFESFSAFDKIAMESISKIAFKQVMAHNGNPKEYLFWSSIVKGCKPNVE
jgi:hypothetical protein